MTLITFLSTINFYNDNFISPQETVIANLEGDIQVLYYRTVFVLNSVFCQSLEEQLATTF